MISFFTMASMLSLFTLLSSIGLIKFEVMRSENIARESFEFLFYIYLFLIGALAASSYEKRSWFALFIKSFTGVVKSVYLGFSGSLVGWGVGLLLYVLFTGKYGSVIFGLVLTCIMIVFTLTPVWYHKQIEGQREAMIGYIFSEPRFAKLLNRIGWVFIAISCYGFYAFFKA